MSLKTLATLATLASPAGRVSESASSTLFFFKTWKLGSGPPCSNARAVSEEKQTILCILYNPLEPFLEVHAGHGTASHDGPFVCLYRVQLKPLWEMSLAETPASKTENLSARLPAELLPPSLIRARRSCS